MTTKSDKDARRFFNKILPHEQWYFSAHPAKMLVQVAFDQYARAWGGFDILQWEWPFFELNEKRPFEGEEPWTVLFRRAVELTRKGKRKAA